jgi:hypothetical protein
MMALLFHHGDVLGLQVTGILPRGLVTLFGYIASWHSFGVRTVDQAYKM